MKNLTNVFYLALALCLSGCVHYRPGAVSISSRSQSPNASYVDTAIGYSRASSFFGIGGGNTTGLYREAKQNLFLANDLEPGQYLDNITSDMRITWAGPYRKTEVIVTADVVQQSGAATAEMSDNYRKKILNKTDQFLNAGDSVLFVRSGSLIRARVLRINHKGVTTLCTIDPLTNNLKLLTTSAIKVFRFKGVDELLNKYNLTLSQELEFNPGSSGIRHARLVGLNRQNALVKSNTIYKVVPLYTVKVKKE